MYKQPTTIHDSEEGDSPIYVGIKYLAIVATQINIIREAERYSLKEKGLTLFSWLNELRTFYDLVEARTALHNSKKEIDFFKIVIEKNNLVKKDIKINESQKYDKWFIEIENMIERNQLIKDINPSNPYQEVRYKNDKLIVSELSKCFRELMKDANSRHLLMPEGQKDIKQKVKDEWIDRDIKKTFD